MWGFTGRHQFHVTNFYFSEENGKEKSGNSEGNSQLLLHAATVWQELHLQVVDF